MTDSSNLGWGSSLDFDKNKTASGRFLPHQISNSINTKELLAVFYGLKSFKRFLKNTDLMIFTDNTTTLSCLLRRGTQNLTRDQITRNIYKIAFKNNILLDANFIPGHLNKIADFSSRHYSSVGEWAMPNDIVDIIHNLGHNFDIDLFGTYLNCKHRIYASYKPDPHATFINAFSVNWSQFTPYIFCPFSLIHRVLKKKMDDQVAKTICIIPQFPSAIWYPQMIKMCIENPILLPKNMAKRLSIPWDKNAKHPLAQKMRTVTSNFIRSLLRSKKLPKAYASQVAKFGWRKSTNKRMGTHLNRWIEYCTDKNLDIFELSVHNILKFLHCLFKEQNRTFRVIQQAKIALLEMRKLSGMRTTITETNYLKKFLKSCFNIRPPIKHIKEYTWDVNILLDLFTKALPHNHDLPANVLAGKRYCS